ncbi:interleukin-11 isoform X2 [Hemibagrus wyckioides]|uniref:interleukin-11 isoform X2 n=1 Tax=Hemibagrus wyckioides TaxID=337641 RepID=UPI00266BD61B|nr:interleukin-11 isoform X2 [Hemibagrus wyckioides]XP_058260480.1 interleukin-11 isoform X2 [Hemibagrus wyckioides]
MKLPESTSLLFLLLLVELPVLMMSRPTPVRPHKAGLTKLYNQMRWLTTVVHGVVHHHHHDTSLPFEHNLTSLPAVNFKAKDLNTVKLNSTLSQLHSGLQSFKLHVDWLLFWQNQSDLVSNKMKEIANALQMISILTQDQTDSPAQSTVLSLPPLTSTWDIYRTSEVIRHRLLVFCNFYVRALRVLISRANK